MSGTAASTEFKARLEKLFQNPAALEERVRLRFNQIAVTGLPGHSAPGIRHQDVRPIVEYLAQMLEVNIDSFGDFEQMFWRFDFSGDGVLDEDEATKMMLCMLRKYRDAKYPPEPGVVSLGSGIETRPISARYDVEKKLGEGGQGAIYLSKDKVTGKQVVVKYYDKTNPNAPLDDITAEFELMMKLQHPRIAHYFDIFQDRANIYVVTEPYFGGDLTTAMQKAGEAGIKVTESWLGGVMKQVLDGVAFLHTKDVMHCDLKEPNAMIAANRDWHAPQVVVIDFGLANQFNSSSGPGGTPGYMPPEVWEFGLWTPKGDVFSLGVMLFTMRTGTPPFTSNCQTMDDVIEHTKKLEPEMTLGSNTIRSLTLSMLKKDFKKRPTLQQVIDDPFFARSTSPSAADQVLSSEVLQKLEKAKETNDFKRALLADLASRENLAEMRELNDLFATLDKDNDGMLTAAEVRTNLKGKWPDADIEAFIKAVTNKDGNVAYEEFMGKLMAIRAPEENKILNDIFREFDADNKGYLDFQNISRLLERPAVARVLGKRDPVQVMQRMDKDGDGQISFDEFRRAMESNSHAKATGLQMAGFTAHKGDKVQYHSATYNQWMSSVVTAVDLRRNALQIDVKPGYWLRGNDLHKIREDPKAAAAKAAKQKSGLGQCCAGICNA